MRTITKRRNNLKRCLLLKRTTRTSNSNHSISTSNTSNNPSSTSLPSSNSSSPNPNLSNRNSI